MPPATYPDHLTFYKISNNEDGDIEQILGQIVQAAKLMDEMPSDEHENSIGSNLALGFTEIIESYLEKFDHASCEISIDSSDFFGNPRPYEADFMHEFKWNLCQNPHIALNFWVGFDAVKNLGIEITNLANHPIFQNNQDIKDVVYLINSSIEHRSEEGNCAIIVILRSYFTY